jgi:hypothetical protein
VVINYHKGNFFFFLTNNRDHYRKLSKEFRGLGDSEWWGYPHGDRGAGRR